MTPLPLLREAREGDLAAVAAIELASFADPWSEEAFRSSLGSAHVRFLVAEDAGQEEAGGSRVAGYVIALLLHEEVEIANIAVSPAARRRGIGGLLLDRVTAEAAERGVRMVFLEVRESNAGARALYESRSFEMVGRRRRYYRHPVEDALLLRRDLPPA